MKKDRLYVCVCVHIYSYRVIYMHFKSIYIYIYIYINQWRLKPIFDTRVPLLCQPVVRGPKVSHHSCYCVILHCIAQID